MGFGISRCKLPYTECVNNKVLFNTGNYIEYPVINHNRKEYERECVCVYIYIYVIIYICVYIYI